jgi:hypothetical protein
MSEVLTARYGLLRSEVGKSRCSASAKNQTRQRQSLTRLIRYEPSTTWEIVGLGGRHRLDKPVVLGVLG